MLKLLRGELLETVSHEQSLGSVDVGLKKREGATTNAELGNAKKAIWLTDGGEGTFGGGDRTPRGRRSLIEELPISSYAWSKGGDL